MAPSSTPTWWPGSKPSPVAATPRSPRSGITGRCGRSTSSATAGPSSCSPRPPGIPGRCWPAVYNLEREAAVVKALTESRGADPGIRRVPPRRPGSRPRARFPAGVISTTSTTSNAAIAWPGVSLRSWLTSTGAALGLRPRRHHGRACHRRGARPRRAAHRRALVRRRRPEPGAGDHLRPAVDAAQRAEGGRPHLLHPGRHRSRQLRLRQATTCGWSTSRSRTSATRWRTSPPSASATW